MKTLFLILFFVFSMGAEAQLAYELSYERKTRTVSLRLENKFDPTPISLCILFPNFMVITTLENHIQTFS